MASLIRQNYHEECEAGVNKQINMELYAMYTYLSMSYYFDRDDVALPGFAKYFEKSAKEELEHAERLMKYQNMRGGRIILAPVTKPSRDEWGNGLDAMEAALQLERDVNESLLKLHKLADDHEDPEMADYLENHYLTEQVEAIKEIGGHITNLKRVGQGHGEYHFDHETLGD